ncbi:MAG: 4Fe-4S binding protein [Methanolobus sp.]
MILITQIIIDEDLCTGCGICTKVCPTRIIELVEGLNLPQVQEENVLRCIKCGHCEVFCPSQALILDLRPDEKMTLPDGVGNISTEDIGFYLKKRRSVRHFTKDPVPREKILEFSTLPVTLHREQMVSRFSG